MKRSFPLIFVLLFFASLVHAGFVMHILSAPSSCPSYYASAIFSWNGDHSSGADYGCEQDGTPRQANSTTAATGTSYGEGGGDIGMEIDADDDYLRWTSTIGVDGTSPQTLCFRIKVSGQLTNTLGLFEAVNSGDQILAWAFNGATTYMGGDYNVAVGTDNAAYGNQLVHDGSTWTDCAVSWNTTGAPMEDGDLSINPGDGVWASTWEEDADELDDEMTNSLTQNSLGNIINAPGASETIYITDFAVVSGYEQACPWQ